MSDRRHPNVVNLSEIEPQPLLQHGERFGSTTRTLGRASGARGIGCSWYEVAPGKAAFPTHFHCANDEAIFVLEGEGTLRVGDARVAVRAGDWVSLPPGPDHAHRLDNTGAVPLRYLCVSTAHTVEVVGYPDSKKLGAAATPQLGAAPWVRELFYAGSKVGYFDGEDGT